MCGTDYNPNIPRVGSKTAYKYICQYENIEGISENCKSIDTSILNHDRVRELFTEFPDFKIQKIPFCGKPKFNQLDKFVTENKININMDKLRKDFTETNIVFE
jgi:5'-3' exonuclease